MSQPPTTIATRQSSYDIVFNPRPYELIWIEQAYLSSHAQRHSQRAALWMDKYVTAEMQLQCAEGKQRRKLRKWLSLLRVLISQDVEQRMMIFTRLAELHIELSSRQQWAGLDGGVSVHGLDPRSPVFVPLGHVEPTESTAVDAEDYPINTTDSSVDVEVVDEKCVKGARKRWSVPLGEKSPWPD